MVGESLDTGITFIVSDAPSPRNPREYPHVPYIYRNYNHRPIFCR